MPASAKVTLAALLAGSILRAFFGAPPTTGHRTDAVRAACVGATCYMLAIAVAYIGHATAASALIVAAVEAMCLAVWLARGRDDPGHGGVFPEPVDPPIDWAEFDRQRERWGSRPRVPL